MDFISVCKQFDILKDAQENIDLLYQCCLSEFLVFCFLC